MRRSRVTGLAVGIVAAVTSWAAGHCETAQISGLETVNFDSFGAATALSGDLMVVGSPGAEGGAGAAYVFRLTGAAWAQEGRLTGAGGSLDSLGTSVATDGSVIVIGAPNAMGAAAGTGVAVVFEFDGAAWQYRQTLSAPDGAGQDFFGHAVAISGDAIVVGAYGDDDAGSASGSAYVFNRTGESPVWTLQQKLLAPDGAAGAQFGWSVAIDGETTIVGANLDDGAALDAGAAYVFDRAGTTWSFTTKLVASDAAATSFFGQSVSLSGNAVLIGAPAADGAEADSGSAYLFRHDGTAWLEEQIITAGDGQALDNFGGAVALSGELAIIGARGEDEAANRAGAAYAFTRTEGSWTEFTKLMASDAAADDFFGASVAASQGRAVAGAIFSDGIDENAGRVYAFVLAGEDCNGNGVPDECDIASGVESDADNDGVPDTCQAPACVCETDNVAGVDVFDLLAYLDDWFAFSAAADLDGVIGVDVFDLLFFLDCWFPASAGSACP